MSTTMPTTFAVPCACGRTPGDWHHDLTARKTGPIGSNIIARHEYKADERSR